MITPEQMAEGMRKRNEMRNALVDTGSDAMSRSVATLGVHREAFLYVLGLLLRKYDTQDLKEGYACGFTDAAMIFTVAARLEQEAIRG